MFSNATQQIPDIFLRKMELDKQIDALKLDAKEGIPMFAYKELMADEKVKELIDERNRVRVGCEKFIQSQRVSGGLA